MDTSKITQNDLLVTRTVLSKLGGQSIVFQRDRYILWFSLSVSIVVPNSQLPPTLTTLNQLIITGSRIACGKKICFTTDDESLQTLLQLQMFYFSRG